MTIHQVPLLPKLKLNSAGKPAIPKWVAPPETEEDLEWQTLRSLDLSLMDGTPEQQKRCEEMCKDALTNEGFLLLEGHGVDEETIQRVFDIANWMMLGDAMTDEDKEEYKWDRENGDWMGYKSPKGWGEQGRETYDGIEAYNLYGACWEQNRLPPRIRPFADEILAYADHMHNHVGQRLYILLSRILGLPDNYLWDQVPGKGAVLPHSSYCRYQVYHPIEDDDTQNILPNHTDHGAHTFLPSQPVTCLQMLGQDGQWRYVPFKKGAMVCNLGDVMEILSGGILKATRHRVCRPPKDQASYERVSVCSFNHARQDLTLSPLMDAPLLQKQGVNQESEVYGAFCKAMEAGAEIPIFGEWKTLRNKNAQEPTSKKLTIGKVAYTENIVGGVKVYRQI